MKIGDKVLANGSVGIIVQKYNGIGFDWEVAFIKNPPLNCWLDCYKEKDLILYNWKNYPKSFLDRLKLLLNFNVKGDLE